MEKCRPFTFASLHRQWCHLNFSFCGEMAKNVLLIVLFSDTPKSWRRSLRLWPKGEASWECICILSCVKPFQLHFYSSAFRSLQHVCGFILRELRHTCKGLVFILPPPPFPNIKRQDFCWILPTWSISVKFDAVLLICGEPVVTVMLIQANFSPRLTGSFCAFLYSPSIFGHRTEENLVRASCKCVSSRCSIFFFL